MTDGTAGNVLVATVIMAINDENNDLFCIQVVLLDT